jgi:hypothetical protein
MRKKENFIQIPPFPDAVNHTPKQRVYFDDEGKLQIITNNGCIEDNGTTTTTKLSGDFHISNADVARLLTIVSGQPTIIPKNGWGICYLATDKDIEEAINHQQKLKEEFETAQKEADKRYCDLLLKVKKHNDKCRGLFSRKMRIDV